MELNIKFNEKMIVEAANRALDEFEYNGKTIREWADTLTHPKTKADRIRAMTDEELAAFIANAVDCCNCKHPRNGCSENDETCAACWLDWLKEEVTDA